MSEMKPVYRFVVVLYMLTAASLCYAGRSRKVEVVKHLNRLNKRPVKSIESPDGDIIDCVRISHQPAFDHPFLKNHTIKETMTQLWNSYGKCPKGTIPVRRTKKEDVLRASSVKRYGKKSSSTFAQLNSIDPDLINQNGHQHAIAYAQGEFYGAKATMNVSPDLYGDNNTRLFIYWTSDAYQATGCYNLLCSGFIQTNNEIALGGSISPISQFDGSQYDITILIWKDPDEGNWWMQFGNGKVLGYWPATLFSYLTESASLIEWGGEVVNTASDGQHTTTQMGSGQFPQEGFSKASYFRNIQIVDESNSLRDPKDLNTFSEQPNCYDVKTDSNGKWGSHFYYGGPGRNPNCP
ncbi:putative neprosin [Helianthus annuus]|nr:putative neprosin [Helianthus annuus]